MKKHLAVVDDDPGFADLLSEFATPLGYRVSSFTSAKNFLKSIDTDPPQLIVLDLIMPDMDGIEVVQALSRQAEGFEVILCTGYNPEYLDIAEVIGKSGAVKVRGKLRKPIRLNDIEALLQTPGV